ncbi:MAG: ClpXP protease specificity-enhancing factor SspB [Cucumibacter sp.]
MSEDLIRFDILAQDALRGVVRKVLSEVAKTGLPGEHHFFITFATTAPGVRISERLLAQYENEMTIVLQHQFWDLSVAESGFEVGLSFEGEPERLSIPFSALKGFFDPSVQFVLQFELTGAPGTAVSRPPARSGNDDAEESPPPPPDGPQGEKIISLDSFRKKP